MNKVLQPAENQLQRESLESLLTRQRLDVPTCLRLAGELARTLGELHAAHLVHQHLRPARLMVAAADTRIVQLDASGAAAEQPSAGARANAAGDWPYLSPEQTGRMNRPVDYRSDFYSLGVVLYRMLTGRLPFQAEDALEWMHCHIARTPPEPAAVCPDIPAVVSALVMRLLAKLPEDRYQSARGLQFDLARCLDQWRATGRVAPFALGTRDVSERFQIPQKLYGREAEKTQLIAAFERMALRGQPALVTVSGPAGIGKSLLVHELQKPIVREQGYFLSGKFDEHQRDIPYATLAQAFRALVQQLLSESDARIAAWRERMQRALGVNGQLIVDLLPQVELIIGKQAAVPTLAPTEARNRFQLVFRRFISLFAQRAHPLVLFLDDLQWADAASLGLIGELLLHREMHHLLLIGAYRDGEVGPTHPLAVMLEETRRQGGAVDDIVLGPFSIEPLIRLIADTLHCAPDAATPLAALIQEKTGGNPFFATQFLAELHQQRLIRFDAQAGCWRWNMARIGTLKLTDNVADLMLEKLARLPPPTQEALKQLACLGNATELSLLAQLLGESDAQAHADLAEAVRAGLAMRVDDSYVFLHDRVREAAYSLLAEGARGASHLRIARLMQARLPQDATSEQVFDLANQFNRAQSCVTDVRERAALVQLNALAGQKARSAVAYASARSYFAQAVALLHGDSWRISYAQTLLLYLNLAEAESLVGNFEGADALLAMLLERAQSRLDRARVYQLRMRMYQVAGRFAETVEVAVEAMRLLGLVLPDEAEADQVVATEMREIAGHLAGRRIRDIVDDPVLDDPELGMLMTLLIDAALPAYHTSPALYRLLAVKPVSLSLRHGNHPASAYAYSRYAVRILSETDDIATACELSEMAIKLNAKFDDRSLKGRVLANHASYILAWSTPLANCLPLLEEACLACRDAGDMSFGASVGTQICWHKIEKGDPLDEVLGSIDKHLAFAQETCNDAAYAALWLQRHFVSHLKGTPAARFDPEALAGNFSALPKSGLGPFSSADQMQLIADFLDGRYVEALPVAQRMSGKAQQFRNMAFEPPYCFYHALTLCALFDQSLPDDQRQFVRTIGTLLARLKFRADHCPENWLNQYALVAAELARIEGRALDAERLYEQAIRAAGDNGYVNNQALAYELAAAFYRARGFAAIADLYLREARACYQRWGADRKLGQIGNSHPRFESQAGAATTLDGLGQLDLLSVAKASQAISGRIVLDELVDTLMRIVIESAGAQTGVLVLVRGERLMLAAEASADRQTVLVRRDHDAPMNESIVPMAILNYVRRSAEQVLLGDAGQAHAFSGDPYFSQRQPKSVLCLPIMRQSSMIGLLYLENNLLPHAFTPERLTVLELLSAQAAISLENALLYADLQHENRERQRAEEMLREREARIRRLIEANIIGVFFWKMDGEIYEANDAFLRILGEDRENLHGGRIRWRDIFANTPEFDARATEEMNRTGRLAPYERELIRKDGERVPVLTGGAYFEGTREQGVNFILDLTEHKRVEEALRRAHEELETRVQERTRELRDSNRHLAREVAERQHAEAVLAERSEDLARSNAELEQFAYIASHDLQEPLRMIGSYMQLLRRRYHDRLDDNAQEFIEYAVDGATRMQALIDDLLTYSRVGSSSRPFQPVALDAVLSHTVSTLGEPIRASGAQVVAAPLPTVMGDTGQLGQLFQNLIGNAIKFRGEAAPRIEIDATPDGEFWRFSVRDNGIGIAPEYAERIFVMFQRLHTRRDYPGTGIGLAICKKIVERHGGRIWIEPNPRAGSTFHFTIPRQR